jgi:hypothetical protein
MESHGLLPIVTLQATVPITTAADTGRRAFGPKAISAPTAMPAAGQNTATPGGDVCKRPVRPVDPVRRVDAGRVVAGGTC